MFLIPVWLCSVECAKNPGQRRPNPRALKNAQDQASAEYTSAISSKQRWNQIFLSAIVPYRSVDASKWNDLCLGTWLRCRVLRDQFSRRLANRGSVPSFCTVVEEDRSEVPLVASVSLPIALLSHPKSCSSSWVALFRSSHAVCCRFRH